MEELLPGLLDEIRKEFGVVGEGIAVIVLLGLALATIALCVHFVLYSADHSARRIGRFMRFVSPRLPVIRRALFRPGQPMRAGRLRFHDYTVVIYFVLSAWLLTWFSAELGISGAGIAGFLAVYGGYALLVRQQAFRRRLELNSKTEFSMEWREINEVVGYTDHQGESTSMDVPIIFNGIVQFITLNSVMVDSVKLVLGDDILVSNWSSKRVFHGALPVELLFGSSASVKRGKRPARLEANVDGEPYTSKPFQVTLPATKQ